MLSRFNGKTIKLSKREILDSICFERVVFLNDSELGDRSWIVGVGRNKAEKTSYFVAYPVTQSNVEGFNCEKIKHIVYPVDPHRILLSGYSHVIVISTQLKVPVTEMKKRHWIFNWPDSKDLVKVLNGKIIEYMKSQPSF